MNRTKAKILIIDDEPNILQVWRMALEDEGFHVHAANSGREGIRTAYDEHPDLVVLDIKMPGMDGFEVLDHLRLMTDVPIIMLTAISTDVNHARALDKGVEDFVPKLAHAQVLISSIHNRLRNYRGGRLADGPLVVDTNLTIDFSRRALYYNDVEVSLTPLQWKLIQCLVDKQGKVATYRELLRAGWDHPDYQDTHLVNVQISLLRVKLHDTKVPHRYIRTAREEGYSFELK